MTPLFTIVSPCKGRRRHLEQALPTFLAQPRTSVVIVDYDCPDGTAAWLRESHPEVRVVKVDHAPTFNLSRARNLGAAAAVTPWLIICDADQLLDASFAARMAAAVRPNVYLRSYFQTAGEAATIQLPLVCETAVYRALGGYDDAIEGWGAEDRDLGHRLEQHGATPLYFPIALVTTLAHPDAERTRFYTVEKSVSRTIGHYYMHIKERYFATRRKPFTDEQRHGTYRQVKAAVTSAAAQGACAETFDIVVPGAEPPWTARIRSAELRQALARQPAAQSLA